ncbi:AP-1 accessory protein LAA1 [Nakaseomyces bracarensis]|uniref:AP-1 accessory protein LAA1 n=1 Tax=Nakaseomyces bracarensis TaxID=273131 RepID=A0ABR4NQQ6_9SACH
MAKLIEIIKTSESKNSSLFNWVLTNFEYLVELENKNKPNLNDDNILQVQNVYDELTEFISYCTVLEDTEVVESHVIGLNISQLLILSLRLLQNEKPGSIFDTAELMTKILSDEVVFGQVDDKDKKKKASNKKVPLFTPAKDFAVIILTQLYETFPAELSSLVALATNIALKSVKKSIEKSKYNHATYMTSLMQLLNRIIRYADPKDIESQTYTKITKLSKGIFETMATENKEFPIDFISALIDVWYIHFTQDSYIKEHRNSLLEDLDNKFCSSLIGIYAFSNDRTRLTIARTIAEIIFSYHTSKKLVDFDNVLDFYVDIFCNSNSRDVKSGCFESLIHFIGLNVSINKEFLAETNYLYIIIRISALFRDSKIKEKHMDSLSRYLRYFVYMHNLLLPRISESAKCQMLMDLMGVKDSESIKSPDMRGNLLSDSGNEQCSTIVQLQFATMLFDEISSVFATDESIAVKVRDKLEHLITSEIFAIRVYASETFVTFLKHFPSFLSRIIENNLVALSKDFESKEKFNFARNHGRAYLTAHLIKICHTDFVPYELIMRLTVFATSYIKNHTTSTHGDVYYKGLVCWIIMTGLMNYNDSQYISMQKSQLFLFWKVLLTHLFTYNSEDELYKNLETRNHAIACLLAYMENARLENDDAKQVSYLLTKCSNFNHSVTVKSKNIDNALIQNENRILQAYLKLKDYVKNDFNSSLLILILKNFSDVNLYANKSKSFIGAVKKLGGKKSDSKDDDKDPVIDNSVSSLLRQSDPFAYGLSSNIIDVYSGKHPVVKKSNAGIDCIDYWYREFEMEVGRAVSPMLLFDSLFSLYDHYSISDRNVVRVTTSLIDTSMLLFSTVFPYLNSKIQYSVIESLNLSMFSKMTVPMRSVAVSANVSNALFHTLNHIHDNNIVLDNEVGQLLMESIRKIEFHNDAYITPLKSECIGLLIAAICRGYDDDAQIHTFLNDQTSKMIKNIAEIEEPYLRIFEVLCLAYTYKYTLQPSLFETVFDVVKTLVRDPHPVVHYWALRALNILLEKHNQIDQKLASVVIQLIGEVVVLPKYGKYGSSIVSTNYFSEFNSQNVVAEIVSTVAEILGPNLSELGQSDILTFRNITTSMLLTNDIICQHMAMTIYENICTFKVENILNDSIFITTAYKTINDAFILGLGSNIFNSNFTVNIELIRNSSSTSLSLRYFEILTQLFRLQKQSVFAEMMETTSWRMLYIYPNSRAVVRYFKEWLLNSISTDGKWLEKLINIFGISREELFKSYFIQLEKLLIQSETKIIKATADDDTFVQDKNVDISHKTTIVEDQLSWRSRKVIVEMIIQVCLEGARSDRLFDLVKVKIPNLIRLAHQVSSINCSEMKMCGLDVIKLLLRKYSSVKDTETSQNYIMSIQEAQITGALMPAFNWISTPEVIRMAIEVAGDLLTSEVIPLDSLTRISKLLVALLTFFTESKSSLKIVNLDSMTQKAKRKVELGILNAWADIIKTAVQREDKELLEFSKTYWDVLVPLWIVSLREYIMTKYEDEKNRNPVKDTTTGTDITQTKRSLYEPVWLNFVQGLSCILEYDINIVLKSLDNDELESFSYILISQCFEEVVRNMDNSLIKMEVLNVLSSILKCPLPMEVLFEEEINFEVVEILNRLVTTGSIQEKSILLDILDSLVKIYTKHRKSHEAFLMGIDKLYELLRLVMSIISDIIPFVKHTVFDDSLNQNRPSELELGLLRSSFKSLENNILTFDSLFKMDLHSCLLFIIGRIYQSSIRNQLVPTVLPLLKAITKDISTTPENKLLSIFYKSVKDYLKVTESSDITLATNVLLVTSGFEDLTEEDITFVCNNILLHLGDKSTYKLAIHGIKSIISESTRSIICKQLLRILIPKMFELLKDSELSDEQSVFIVGLVIKYTKSFKASKDGNSEMENSGASTEKEEQSSKSTTPMLLSMLFIVAYIQKNECHSENAMGYVEELMNFDSEGFKGVVSNLDNSQKTILTDLMAKSASGNSGNEKVKTFNLKTFNE